MTNKKSKAKSLKVSKPETKKKLTKKEEKKLEMINEKAFSPWQVKFIEEFFYQRTLKAAGPIAELMSDALGTNSVKDFARDISIEIAQAAMWEIAKEHILNSDE